MNNNNEKKEKTQAQAQKFNIELADIWLQYYSMSFKDRKKFKFLLYLVRMEQGFGNFGTILDTPILILPYFKRETIEAVIHDMGYTLKRFKEVRNVEGIGSIFRYGSLISEVITFGNMKSNKLNLRYVDDLPK